MSKGPDPLKLHPELVDACHRVGRAANEAVRRFAEAWDQNVGEACRGLQKNLHWFVLDDRPALRPKLNKKLTDAQWRARRSARRSTKA